MITLNDIAESSSALIKGELVLHRSMNIHPVIKAIKIYTYSLYYLLKGEKKLLFTHRINKNTSIDDMDKAWEECDKEYLREFVKWIAGEDFKTLMTWNSMSIRQQ